MITTSGKYIVFTGILLIPTQVFSQDNSSFFDSLTVVGGATYIYKSVDFKVGGKPFKPKFAAIDWSIITAYKNAYLKLNFDQSLKDYTFINNTIDGNGGFDNNFISINREDTGLTIGYSITDNISIFGGLKHGKTGTAVTGRLNTVTITNPPGDFTYIQNSNFNFKEEGPFLGFSYTYPLKNSGAFSFSLAFADMDGEVSISEVSPNLVDGNFTVFNQTVLSGDSSGLSYSINWTDQLVESINYKISLKTTRYKVDVPPPPSAPNEDFDFNEIINSLSIGFSKFF